MPRPRSLTQTALLVALSSCGLDDGMVTPPPPPALEVTGPGPFLVSEPVVGNSGDASRVYIALPSARLDASTRLVARVRRTGAVVSAQTIAGGFDPFSIEAVGGDTLILEIQDGTASALTLVATVPQRRPPVIVRTVPPRGTRDVALNARMQVVFSEPMSTGALTPGAVVLRAEGEVVAGVAQFVDVHHTTIEFVPELPLLAGTEYQLVVQHSVKDLDGTSLAGPTSVDFSTVGSIAPPPAPPPTSVGMLAFASRSDRQIYTMRADGSARTRLTTIGHNEYPTWSPDGRRIAFSRSAGLGGVKDIYIMNADGSNVVRRTGGSGQWRPEWLFQDLRVAEWSPDGRWLAVSTQGLYYSRIWIIPVEEDGGPPFLLADAARSPAWSPDGQRIAFVRISGDDGYDAINVINVDGTGEGFLAPIGGYRLGLTWSPDGQSIASSECVSGSCNLFIMSADGSNTRRVTGTGDAGWGGDWSPDGLRLAVTLWGWPGGPSVALVPATGGEPQVIASDAFVPTWRP